MAKKSKIVFDKTEIIVMDTSGSRARLHNLTFDKIVSIRFDNENVRILLATKPTEVITITVRGEENPIKLYRNKEEEFFEGYKTGLEEFAKTHRITFYNNLTS